MSKLGIRCSLEEAMAISASAKEGTHGDNLSQNEFKQLLFSHDDTMTVNLNSIKAPTNDEKLATFSNIQLRNEPKRLDFSILD